jgi:hypothetical protein
MVHSLALAAIFLHPFGAVAHFQIIRLDRVPKLLDLAANEEKSEEPEPQGNHRGKSRMNPKQPRPAERR